MAYNGRLGTGLTTTNTIATLGEQDTWVTSFIQGLTYTVKASGAYSGGGSLQDPYLELLNSSGSTLLANDDITPGVNRDAQLTFRVSTTGDYILRVHETGNNALGSYTFAVSAGYASNGNDRVIGTAANDAIVGMAGNDTLAGAAGNDRLWGEAGSDELWGGYGNDVLDGGDAVDAVIGQVGNDVLVGGLGADRLYGGSGADTFYFRSAAESATATGADWILADGNVPAMEGIGVAGGDVIDLSGIDANVYAAGNQSFVWDANKSVGSVWLEEINGHTVLRANIDNDVYAEFSLVIADGAVRASQYGVSDFVL